MPQNYQDLQEIINRLEISEQDKQSIIDSLCVSDYRWKAISENIPEFIFFLNSEFEIEYSNLKSLGYDVDDTGLHLKELVDPEERDKLVERLNDAKTTGLQVQYQTISRKQEGTTRYFDSIATPRKKDGVITGYIVYSKDVTKYKFFEDELRERIKELDGLLGLGRLTEKTQHLPELFQRFLSDVVPNSMQFPEKVCAKIKLDDSEYNSNDFECVSCLSSKIFVKGIERGFLRVGYNENIQFIENFESKLIEGYAERLGKIIERLEASDALKKSEQRYLLAQRAAKIGSWEWDIQTGDLYWSDTIESMFGFEEGEFGKTYEAFLASVHPGDRENVISAVEDCVNNKAEYDIEHRIVWPDGSVKWLNEVGDAQRDENGKAVRMFGVVQDITERKRSEKMLRQSRDELEDRVRERTNELAEINLELQREIRERKKTERMLKNSREQLRELTLHIESVREKERTRISREIHDDLGQALTACKLDLIWLKNRMSEDDVNLIEKTESMCTLVDDTIKTVQRISTELRPGLLDDLGLSPAIEWQISEFIKRTEVKCDYNLTINDDEVPESLATIVFRIFQEALTNIMRHAHADEVIVNLSGDDSKLVLEVIDNGRGITEKQMNDKRSFGIMGMQERIRPLKGKLLIKGDPDKGTTVKVIIPGYKIGVSG